MASSYTLTLRISEFNQATVQAFKQVVYKVGLEFTRVITEPRLWDGFENERDIVDTGILRSSQRVVFFSDTSVQFSWPLEYAVYVHEGYTLRDGRTVQGRPWTQIATQEFDAQAEFTAQYQIALKTSDLI